MAASAGCGSGAAGCAGCASRDAVIARLEAALEESERGRQAAVDRLEFVEPMYGTVRARYEELYALHRDIRGKCAELKADYASLDELFGVVKRQAARAVGLESERDELKARESMKDGEIRRPVAALRGHAKGRIAYPAGPSMPPSEAGAGGGGGGGGARHGKAEEADSGQARRQEGPRGARRVVRPERQDRHPQVSQEG